MRTPIALLASLLLALAGCASPAPSSCDAVELARVDSAHVVARWLPGKDHDAHAKGGIDPLVPRQVVQVLDRLGITTNGVYTSPTSYDVTADQTSVGTRTFASGKYISLNGTLIRAGSGSPEGSITAPVGSLYARTNGGAGTVLYVKESGSGNTGWVAYGAGGSQTPWTGDVDAANHNLTGVGAITAGTGDFTLSAATGGYNVTVTASNGDAGSSGADAILSSGTGNNGATAASVITCHGGGSGTEPGYVTIAGVTSATVSGQIIDYGSGATLTLTEAQCKGQIYRLNGSVAQTINLPDAGASIGSGEEGALVTFICENTAGVKIQLGTGDTLATSAGTSASAGYIHSSRSASRITVARTASATWTDVGISGTWRFDSTTSAGYAYTPTPWTSFDPETVGMGWTGANVSATGYYQHSGAVVDVRVQVTCTGAPNSTTLAFTAPLGTVDSTIMVPGVTSFAPCGNAVALDAGTLQYGPYIVGFGSGGYGSKFIIQTTTAPAFITQAAPFTFGNGDGVVASWSYAVAQ